MGFWKSLFGIEDNKSEVNKQEKSEFNTTFVTYDEEKDFEESIYGALQLYSADIEYISEVLPERGENLRKQIKRLLEILDNANNEDDLELRNVFRDLKLQFEEDKTLADGEYTIKELEYQNEIMDKIFDTPIYNEGITKEKLEQYINLISKIQRKIAENEEAGNPILTKIQKQKFSNLALKSEYRIKMLELMYLLNDYSNIEINPFKELSSIKRKMFSKMFFEDAKKVATQYEILPRKGSDFYEYSPSYFESIDSMAKELNDQITNVKMIDDFSIAQLFDTTDNESKSFEFLKRFIRLKIAFNNMESEKDRISKVLEERRRAEQKMEEEKRQEEAEKARKENEKKEALEMMKAYTDADIKKEIYRIEHDLTAQGSRFVNILEFQKKVARAKGLLGTEEQMINDEVAYKAVDAGSALEIIEKANTLGVSYAAFPDCQELRDGGILFVFPKLESEIFTTSRESVKYPSQTGSLWITDKEFGQYPAVILNRLYEHLGESNIIGKFISANSNGMSYNLSIGHSIHDGRQPNPSFYEYKNKILNVLNIIKSELEDVGSSPEELQDVMCYISVPATRNIIPILEEFKKAGISSYLEPVPRASKRNENKRNNIQIYFERDDLEKVKETVMENISNSIVGIATLNWDNKSLGSAIKDEISWSEEEIKDK